MEYEKLGAKKSLNSSKKTSIFRFSERDIKLYRWLLQNDKQKSLHCLYVPGSIDDLCKFSLQYR